jgi:hypothetical protein
MKLDEEIVTAATLFGVPASYINRVYAYYIACDVQEDGYWSESFEEWLLLNFDDWDDLRDQLTAVEG